MKKIDLQILLFTGLGALIFSNIKNIKSEIIKFLYPVYGRITSKFGLRIHPVTGESKFHNGIDIAGKDGDKIRCPFDGTVAKVYFNSIGGNQLIIQHSNGYITGYAHLKKVFVSSGNNVLQGQIIAEVGNTGRSTGPHLHFTLKDNNSNYLDPIKYLI
jgi:murein DD-endopeptidase MepM/ murein hydrolase activator NlpD